MGYTLALFGTVAVLVQVISSQCIGKPLNAGPARGFGNGLPYGSNLAGASPFGPNLAGAGSFGPNLAGAGSFGPSLAGAGSFGPNLAGAGQFGPNLAGISPGCAASTGGSFAVTSASPVSPTGVSVLAENLAIEGPLAVGGNLPFLGTVGIEGAMPGAGAGSVSYGCGSGSIGIVSENAVGVPGPYGLAGSPITTATAGSYGLAGPSSVGSYGASISPAVGPYGITGSGAISSPYVLAGSSLGPSAGITSAFGLGSPNAPASFGAGLGFNGFNGFGGLNGLRK